ncbi:basic region leucine zipper, partial [Ostertagia ostertagi]
LSWTSRYILSGLDSSTSRHATDTHFPFSGFLDHLSMNVTTEALWIRRCLAFTPAEPQSAVTPKKARLDSPCSPLSQSSTVSSTQLSSPQASPARKLAKPIPDEKKDEAYYERRRRNNDAAKRSRDARRFKEELIAERATRLEQENGQLQTQQLSAVTATKADNKSESIDALLHNTRTTVLPSDMEVQP